MVILVGNKCDLASDSLVSRSPADGGGEGFAGQENGSGREEKNKRAVTKEEAEEWCRRNNVLRYVETSAKSGEGVERAFLEVAERIYQNIEAGRYDLNDRRSGVKGRGATAGVIDGTRSTRGQGTVVLGMNDVVGKGGGGGWGGGCC